MSMHIACEDMIWARFMSYCRTYSQPLGQRPCRYTHHVALLLQITSTKESDRYSAATEAPTKKTQN